MSGNAEPKSRPAQAFKADEYAMRIRRLVSVLRSRKLDGAVIKNGISRLYYTGFESSAGTLLIDAEKGPVFIVDFRYIFMAKKAMPFVKCVMQKSGAPSELAKHTSKWKSCGFETNDSYASVEGLKSFLSKIEKWEPIDADISMQRAVKSAAEQKLMRKVIAANDAMYAWVLPQIHPGMSEWEMRNIFRRGADLFGQGESFDTIACVGANGAECHHEPGESVLGAKGQVLMDFGLVLDHYCADMTRCVSFGKPSKFYTEIFKIVLDANRKAVDRIKPGMTGEEVDAIARRHIAAAGYGDAFGHSLGHGLGMEVHESPNFSPREKRVIKPGMIITVEPGIYLAGKVGVRIEDVVLITRNGCECLTRSPRDLVIL